MPNPIISRKQIHLNTDRKSAWDLLTQSQFTRQYMFNCSVESDWQKGSSIIWQGNFNGYEAFQKGEILDIQEYSLIKYSTFDPNFGLEDLPKNYIHVTYELTESNNGIELTIINETFDGNAERMEHINQGWDMVIPKIKDLLPL